MENKKIIFNIVAIAAIIIFAFSLTPVTLQNDTFYTIKIGELITKNGIDMTDHFSWHEDLAYTYPHWAYDTGMYLIYNLGELTGIQDGGMLFIYLSTFILASILGILIYYTSKKLSKNYLISFILSLLVLYLLKDFIAARAQLLTYIMFVLTILFIESFLDTKKKRYLIGLIIISIIIANVHAAVWPFFFILFIPYIVEYIIVSILDTNIISKLIIRNRKNTIKKIENKITKVKDEKQLEKLNKQLEQANKLLEEQCINEEKVQEKSKQRRENPYRIRINKNKEVKWLIIIMIICAFTGFLTPIGNTPYTYLVKTMQGNTTNSISEHAPLVLYNDAKTMIALALVLIILIFTDTKIKLRDLFMISGLIFMAFMSRRQVSLMVLIGGFIFAKLLDSLLKKYDSQGCKQVETAITTIVGRIITLVIIIIISMYFYKPKMDDSYIDNSRYPVEASTWILENLDIENMKLYNEYNYGSYLVYRGIPVFIDSRADLYAPEFTIREGEEKGRDIFSDYINISSIGTYYEDKFEKYGITHLIMVKNSKLNMFISRNDNYKQLYKDDYFVIYERNV